MIKIEQIKDLLEKARSGDEKAFEEVYTTLYDPVFIYIYLRVKNKPDAEDIAQTTFLKVYQSIDRFSVTDKHPLSFFFTVARNTIIDESRKKKHQPIASDEMLVLFDKGESVDFEEKERKRYIETILSELKEEEREILEMSEIQGYSGKEIAEILGKSEVSIRKQKQRIIEKIRKNIKEKNGSRTK